MSRQKPADHSPNHSKYWGLLAPDAAHKYFHTPENFMDLLQTQFQNVKIPIILPKTKLIVEKQGADD